MTESTVCSPGHPHPHCLPGGAARDLQDCLSNDCLTCSTWLLSSILPPGRLVTPLREARQLVHTVDRKRARRNTCL